MIRFMTIPQCEGDRLDRMLRRVAKDVEDRLFDDESTCVICKRHTKNIVVYTRGDGSSDLFGMPQDGRERIAVLTLCEWHAMAQQEETDTRIYRELIQQWQ